MESFRIYTIINTDAKTLYKAWMDSKKHTAFTGGDAKVDPKINGKFSAWDGYITGRTVELVPYTKIVQKWRTIEFTQDAEDSILEILFEEKAGKTKLTIYHHKLSRGDVDRYKRGWKEHYFSPMKDYFQ